MIEFEYDKTGVGRRLEMLRKKANSSREKAAEDLDISKDSLYAYEKGKSIMSAEVLAKVCILYNTSMDYLLNGCESENNVIIPEIMISLGKYNAEQQKHMYAALSHESVCVGIVKIKSHLWEIIGVIFEKEAIIS